MKMNRAKEATLVTNAEIESSGCVFCDKDTPETMSPNKKRKTHKICVVEMSAPARKLKMNNTLTIKNRLRRIFFMRTPFSFFLNNNKKSK
ncbi:hypothetical protein G3A_13565 [Bacillus sp. 17376]|uniref:Uncharacterized protein n=1 Tax=Mesobacillus boroniphilus JCM 21738 TaxID=1294265 RepID=W4RTZ2_9BACI|nr:hypothetical protein [Mesobacillus boroniphilus]ESU32003.1 hypothetical protein G3A_13565 [Bacillus sp. 17376]GAE47114.1 hypothetical protein JCM21738_4061 [Mesobacillus boroniphilus JCM 21738]